MSAEDMQMDNVDKDTMLSETSPEVLDADDRMATWSELCTSCKEGIANKSGKDWAISFARFCGLIAALWCFLFALDLMGSSFKIIGGCQAGAMFDNVSNPIAGLMVGIIATVLVQSSSTSTSIVVSLVGSGGMSVNNAIPVIMGANIGTSVTNTIVSMGQIGNSDEYERAFAGATVHDMFNFLSVAVLLPIELITGFLERLTGAMKPSDVKEGEKWEGPIKIIVAPAVKKLFSVNKDVTKNVAKGKWNCEDLYANLHTTDENSTYFEAAGLIKGGAFYKETATQQDDTSVGVMCLLVSLVLLVICLMCLVSLLQQMVFGTSQRLLRRATKLNPYVAMVVGMIVTILVQSSSITTSVLTPLVGVGVLPLEQMFPLTLGANVGTTATALLASLVSTKPEAVQIALAHLFFNIVGTLIWFPIPFMRRIPLNAAKNLGALTRRSSLVPVIYIAFAFVFAPLCLIGLTSLYEQGVTNTAMKVGAILITIALVVAFCRAIFWWKMQDGRHAVFNFLERREATKQAVNSLPDTMKELQENQAQMLGRLDKIEGLASSRDVQVNIET